VLGAVEGLELLNADAAHAVVPISLTIIVLLFAIQRHGTGHLGRLFGRSAAVVRGAGLYRRRGDLAQPAGAGRARPRYGLNLLFTHQKVALVLLAGCS